MTSNRRKHPPSDRALRIALRVGVAILALAMGAFASVYYLGQRADAGPSLAQRQIQAAERQVRDQPNNLAPRLALAQAYQSAHRLDDAIAQYDQILHAAPAHRAAILGKAGALLAKGDLTAAGTWYGKVTSAAVKGEFAGADPQLEEAHYFLALIASRQNRPAQAISEARAALKIEPTDSDAWYLLGKAQVTSGQPAAGVVSLRRALLFVPTGWCEPYAALVGAYRTLGKGPQSQYATAMVAFCQKRIPQAQQQLRGLTTGPAAADAWIGLGQIAESTGRQADAVTAYRRARDLEPTNTAVIEALARLGVGPTASASGKG